MAKPTPLDHQLHKRLLDHLSTAVLLLDQDLRLRYLNPAAEMLLSTSAQRAVGQPLPECFFDDPDAQAALIRCIEEGHPFTRREARLQFAPGQELTVDYSVAQLAEPGRSPSLLMELQPLDRLLRIAREEALVHAHQATRALVRGVAHEIKNPLGGIRGAAQLLERALPAPDLAEYTRVIIDEADRLRALADRMLGPRRLPNFRSLNIHECLEHVRQLILAEHPEGVRVQRDYDISLPEIPADRDQLIQVILNLARNAVQALTEANMPDATVIFRTRVQRQFTIGAQRHRLIARIDIQDNGPGIPEELRETLFYPMVSGRANGSGLGLSIAQSIISQHQGMIECESTAGRTVFSLLLPMEHITGTEGESESP
ncbi:signal transduction histidine kinase, nitrogen specific, NtrB [Isoalcanivorax pacificus W11-5]|uniref:Sensory histidine kinase/phosphatase NtrB n=1 Tax=Isoalcanivorax pacificus W11-5 TaxID=391936 RepID=A0A0B4XJY3_9GAMM|nr:nitrogen regulation protein NR(II) [Isoalcanivorax pacificus]AJD46737.1 signal transduction histidine kinase, nitrogen specific, NtrB [Isoalcanivorax pacificus W11-5]